MYDVAPFLEDFLASLRDQALEDFEAILVDDGSTDDGPAIAAAWSARDARFRLAGFPNGGLGRARNRGLEIASGRFVAFADPDDLILPRGYERMVRALDASGSAIATAPALQFFDGGRPEAASPRYWTTAGPMWDLDRTVAGVSGEPGLVLDHTAWNKVFRRDRLVDSGFGFPVDTTCEDVHPIISAYLRADAVDIVSEPVYAHRRRAASITSGILSDRVVLDWTRQTGAVLDELASAGAEVRARYLTRMLRDEAWTRVAEIDALVSAEAGDAVQALAVRLHAAADDDVRSALDPFRRLQYGLLASDARELIAELRRLRAVHEADREASELRHSAELAALRAELEWSEADRRRLESQRGLYWRTRTLGRRTLGRLAPRR
jgi:glycosyltransferase involved in cell wall biosynthesis